MSNSQAPATPESQTTSLDRLKQLLSARNSRVKVSGTWFNKKEVHLDGYEFENCRFDNCKLITANGDFVMKECHLASDNMFLFSSGALRVVKAILYRITSVMPLVPPSFVSQLVRQHIYPQQNPDGTINIEE